jgi:hypothetical protein
MMGGSENNPTRPARLEHACWLVALGLFAAALLGSAPAVRAIGATEAVDVRRVSAGSQPSDPHPRAAQRLAWEVRKRTSIDDPSIFRTPLLYWAGDRAFADLSDKERTGLRRFVEYGGFLIIDDAAPEVTGFDSSVRRALAQAFPGERLVRLSAEHTVFRSFYLLDRPYGRLAQPDHLEAIQHAGRAAVVYARNDLGGAWAADDTRDTSFVVVPGGSAQREQAIRLGVNLVMYALCLDYKDDQVHAPFLLRRRAGRP